MANYNLFTRSRLADSVTDEDAVRVLFVEYEVGPTVTVEDGPVKIYGYCDGFTVWPPNDPRAGQPVRAAEGRGATC